MRKILFFAVFLFPAFVFAVDYDVLSGFLKKHSEIISMEADFIQEVSYETPARKTASSGKLYLKKPGRMRLIFSPPLSDEFVSDGKKYWVYQADLAQAMEMPLSSAPAGFGFLDGTIDLKKEFALGKTKKTDSGYEMEFFPKNPDLPAKKAVLETDADFSIVKIIVTDGLGAITSVTLKNKKINQDMPDDFFVFKAPKGVTTVKP
ncbi:MAG TPA: outer membrane lipoprotein carrier protein LolA [Thermodesulfobacteriota bacterium]|nr:outer membrane lipoprotein carrier protein LolA [Thermodesulfobacteriota bacterium]